jgi:uncharacterized protein (TIGR03067 family)
VVANSTRWLVLILSFVAMVRPTAADEPSKAGDSVYDVWKLVRAVRDGEEMPERKNRAGEVIVSYLQIDKEKAYIVTGPKLEETAVFTLGPDEKPRKFEVVSIGRYKLNLPGILELKGDELKLCLAGKPNQQRPTAFESKRGDGQILIVFSRESGQAKQRVQENVKRAALPSNVYLNNLKQMALAMHNLASTTPDGRLPAAAIKSKDGKPLLSWRVAILPYIEQANLYREFHLDEPWDSEHNKKLLDVIPKLYLVSGTKTPWRVFTGEHTAFEGKGVGLGDFGRSISNTLLIVEAAESVPWTKPEELEYTAGKPLPKLGGNFTPGRFYACMADGSAGSYATELPEKSLRSLIVRNGAEK